MVTRCRHSTHSCLPGDRTCPPAQRCPNGGSSRKIIKYTKEYSEYFMKYEGFWYTVPPGTQSPWYMVRLVHGPPGTRSPWYMVPLVHGPPSTRSPWYIIITFIFRYVNATLPLPLLQLFDFQYDIHGHNTRHSKDLRPPQFNTALMKRSFLYDGPELWMNLDESIKNAGTRNILKNRIRNKFLDEY